MAEHPNAEPIITADSQDVWVFELRDGQSRRRGGVPKISTPPTSSGSSRASGTAHGVCCLRDYRGHRRAWHASLICDPGQLC